MSAPAIARKPRKTVPKIVAVIDADECSGCLACVEVCPVDCIDTVPGEDHPGVAPFCEIDLDRCVGCRLCAIICPWDAAFMVDTPSVADHVATKGGPPRYVHDEGEALIDRAARTADAFLARKRK